MDWSGRTKSCTEGTLELCCYCCDRCCSVVLLKGRGKTLASLFFKLCCSSSGQAAPAGSFHRCRLELDWFGVTPFPFIFQEILESLVRVLLASFVEHQLSIKQWAWHAVFLHPDDMSYPTKVGLEKHCFNVCCLDSIQDLKIGDLVLPAKDGTEGIYTKLLQLLNVPAVQCPGLAPIEKKCKSNRTADLELRRKSDVVLVEHRSAKPSKA